MHFESQGQYLQLLITVAVVLCALAAEAGRTVPWVVYYSDEASIASFRSFDVVIFDSENHPSLQPFHDQDKTLLGYLSLGEVADYRNYFDQVKSQNILLHENQVWKGSFFVDLRDPRWTSRVIEVLIPKILDEGFQGVFLDTLDDAEHLEQSQPEHFSGMTAAAASLVKAIRLHFPHIVIMLNRAYAILPEVAMYIDMELGESVYTSYDFASETYIRVKHSDYQWQVERLRNAQELNPQIQIMTLDYWNPDDDHGIARIYAEQRANGFSPYVATIELDRIICEPKP